jgi:ferric-dicitrate binding protein FerR (iron transport regulator)
MALSRLEYLFDCYVSHKCSEEEEKEFMALLVQSENEMTVKKLIEGVIRDTGAEIDMSKRASVSILQKILHPDEGKVVPVENKKSILRTWMRIAAAAVVILFISGVSYWIITKEKHKTTAAAVPQVKSPQILPGGNHAVLTMADGSTIVLDRIQNGKIQHGSATINKQNGLLVYDGSAPLKAGVPVTYNTLSTPRGGQYQVVLPDGSRVWLNASSSLHFPTAFVGEQREVELTGEAYFEVAKNKEKPFHVKVNGMQVEVLGTHFNVNAYPDEDAVRTSLLEGSVKITNESESGMLKPGQQGVLKKNNKKIEIKSADMDEVIAWKNGLFQFDGADITTILREIGRWYNVDIIYAGKVPVRSFEGKISREAQLSDVLKILELSNVKFDVEGKKIIVQ